ncbi:MAG: hypothetical protein ACR2J9_00345 [Gaiellales bacterium]
MLPGTSWAPCGTTATYGPLNDGTYTLQARSTDSADNVSATTSVSWAVDTTAPVGVAAIVSGPDAITPAAVATFQFTYGSDGTAARCSVDGGVFAACRPPFVIPSVAVGTHTFEVEIADAAGNVGANRATYAWEVFIPTTPPVGPVGLRIANGDAWVTSNAVILNMIWPNGARWIEVADDAAFTNSVRHTVTTQLAWTLEAGAPGARTVHLRFLDAAGALMSTTSDTVGLDPIPPVVATVEATENADRSVTVTPTLTDAESGIAGWQATIDPAQPGVTIAAGTASTIIRADVGSTIYVRAIDAAGNVSAWHTRATPVLPPVAPVVIPSTPADPNAVIVGGRAFVTTTTFVTSAGSTDLNVGCAAAAGGTCDVRVDLVYGKKVKATSSARIPSGGRSTVNVPLPKDLQRRLATDGTLSVDMNVSAATGDGVDSAVIPVVLQAPAATGIQAISPTVPAPGATSTQVSLRCAGMIPYHCAGPISVIEAPTGARAGGGVIAVATVKGAAGENLTATISLNAAGKRLLAKRGTLSVIASATLEGSGATGSSSAFTFTNVRASDWLRQVIRKMDQGAPTRMRLNNVLDLYRTGRISAAVAARIVEHETLVQRQATLDALQFYRTPPKGLERASALVQAAYRQSIAANEAFLRWLRTGGRLALYPWRPSAKASATKAKLIAELQRQAKPLGIPVRPVSSYYP